MKMLIFILFIILNKMTIFYQVYELLFYDLNLNTLIDEKFIKNNIDRITLLNRIKKNIRHNFKKATKVVTVVMSKTLELVSFEKLDDTIIIDEKFPIKNNYYKIMAKLLFEEEFDE